MVIGQNVEAVFHCWTVGEVGDPFCQRLHFEGILMAVDCWTWKRGVWGWPAVQMRQTPSWSDSSSDWMNPMLSSCWKQIKELMKTLHWRVDFPPLNCGLFLEMLLEQLQLPRTVPSGAPGWFWIKVMLLTRRRALLCDLIGWQRWLWSGPASQFCDGGDKVRHEPVNPSPCRQAGRCATGQCVRVAD